MKAGFAYTVPVSSLAFERMIELYPQPYYDRYDPSPRRFQPLPAECWLNANGDYAAFFMRIERGGFTGVTDHEQPYH